VVICLHLAFAAVDLVRAGAFHEFYSQTFIISSRRILGSSLCGEFNARS